MRILVGVTPDASAADAMSLASVLQSSFAAEVVLGNIFPAPADSAGKTKVDAEWVAYMRSESVEILADVARDADRWGLTEFTTAVHGHRSSGVGLIELAEAVDADLIVIGSAPGSANGRFLIGSTADQLLHGSHVPVALATTGYRRVRPDALGRLVVAFQDTQESRTALRWAADNVNGRRLTALTILLRHRVMGSQLAFDTEGLITRQLAEDAQAALDDALLDLGAQADAQMTVGDDASSAIQRFDWNGDELFVLASSRGGVLRRVFLGDMTYKLVRATPVPALVLPRRT
ncbi:MAG: universal stress protein [Micrococcales bacterium]|nr:universal stress protein [Micrococcales bacterium]